MRTIPVYDTDHATVDAIRIQSCMLFPDEEEKRLEFCLAIAPLVALKEAREAHADDAHITLSCKLLDEVSDAIDYFVKNAVDREKRKAMGKRAATIATTLIAQAAYYKQTGSKKTASLSEAYSTLIGWSVEYAAEHGVNLGHNRASLNEAWQKYGHVAHLWVSDNFLQEAIDRELISDSTAPEYIDRRLQAFLHGAKATLNQLRAIVPHGRKEPVIDLQKVYWVSEEVDCRFVVDDRAYEIGEETMQMVRESIKRYKGARDLGKKRMKTKLETTALAHL